MKLQLNGKTYQITIPASIIRAKDWKKGDNIDLKIDKKGDIILKKK